MFRFAIFSVLIASVAASRVEIAKHKVKSQFGASCEDLQTMFRNRVLSLQALLDSHPDQSHFSTATQARFMMRSYGVVRTLRRANTCAWVVDGDSADIEQVRGIVQNLIAGNPCADAARVELAAGSSAETAEVEVQALWRAMSVLQSDDCEAAPYEESDTVSLDDEAVAQAQLEEMEAQGQDNVDEAVDAMEMDGGGAFVQTDSDVHWRTFRRVMRTLGVVFLMLFLLLACAGTTAVITAILTFVISQFTIGLWCPACRASASGMLHAFNAFMYGLIPGLAVGLGACSYQLYNRLLPALVPPTNITSVTQ